MYRMRKAIFCLFVLIFTFVLQNGGQLQAATLPGFSISRYNIAVVLQTDGSAEVTENDQLQD